MPHVYLLADAVTLDTGVLGAVIAVVTVVFSVGGSFLAFYKSTNTVENRVNTQGQDIEALERRYDSLEKKYDELQARVAQAETREGRTDERMRSLQGTMEKLEKGQERIASKLDDLLDIERSHAKRRRTDTDEAA